MLKWIGVAALASCVAVAATWDLSASLQAYMAINGEKEVDSGMIYLWFEPETGNSQDLAGREADCASSQNFAPTDVDTVVQTYVAFGEMGLQDNVDGMQKDADKQLIAGAEALLAALSGGSPITICRSQGCGAYCDGAESVFVRQGANMFSFGYSIPD